MAKGPVITDSIRMLIALVFDQNKDWRAKEIREEVNRQLREVNPHIQPGWPGLSAIQKEVTKLRKNYAERPPELKAIDQPWSAMDMVKYPISPDALPAVLENWVVAREHYGSPLTIREVLWVSRIFAIFRKDEFHQALNHARGLATIERLEELTGLSLRSASIDLSLYMTMMGLVEMPEEREEQILSGRGIEGEGTPGYPTVVYADVAHKLAKATIAKELLGPYEHVIERIKEEDNERSHTQKG